MKDFSDPNWIVSEDKIYDWGALNNEGKKFIRKVLEEWNKFLTNKRLKEEDYHEFLSNYAGFFLTESDKSYQVISKLKLGADYETDFVVICEGFSKGIFYELIEIESPHSKPFNKNGQPSHKLIHSVQQIMNWRSWIQDNRHEFSRVLPYARLVRDSNVKFKIIIGTRENSRDFIEERNQYTHEMKIEIRSFDSLTDNLEGKTFHESPWIFSAEARQLPLQIRNKLANPFYKATKDADWRKICRKIEPRHSFAINYELILWMREYNDLLNRFIKQYRLKHGK